MEETRRIRIIEDWFSSNRKENSSLPSTAGLRPENSRTSKTVQPPPTSFTARNFNSPMIILTFPLHFLKIANRVLSRGREQVSEQRIKRLYLNSKSRNLERIVKYGCSCYVPRDISPIHEKIESEILDTKYHGHPRITIEQIERRHLTVVLLIGPNHRTVSCTHRAS